jgi:glycosyltransferase involved in cell wall biosynthesis
MRSLMIIKVSPIREADTACGNYTRYDLFASALRSISSEVEIAWFGGQETIEAFGPMAPHEAKLSRAWGLPVRLSPIVTREPRRKTMWTHYGAGALSMRGQPEYWPSTGPSQAAAVAEALNRQPDLVLVARLMSMGAVMRSGVRPQRLFFDLDDIEHKKLTRIVRAPPLGPGKLLYAAHVPPLLLAERRALRMADATFVCSEEDRRHLQRIGMGRGVTVVPNGLPVPAHPAPPCPEPTILFLGTYGYEANCDAAHRLVTRIFPIIRQQVPAARLIVAGTLPQRIPSFRSAPDGVEFTGFVEDLDALYARSRVIACPVTTGSGTRIKLLEGASYGRPMVSTQLGAEGLSFQDGRDLLLRDDDAGFATACAELLRDDAACARLGAAARAQMRADYADEGIIGRIARIMSGKLRQSLAA